MTPPIEGYRDATDVISRDRRGRGPNAGATPAPQVISRIAHARTLANDGNLPTTPRLPRAVNAAGITSHPISVRTRFAR